MNQPLFRIMIRGEDTTLFCYDSHLTNDEAVLAIQDAVDNYPNAEIWLERMEVP